MRARAPAWLRADTQDGPYTVIEGANASKYTLTEADSGQSIRVEVSAAAGSAVSAAFGPVERVVSSAEVFAAIERQYLGQNSHASNILTKLNLMSTLAEYPGVTIAWASDKSAVIDSSGNVTRSASNDEIVKLTATLDGAVKGTKVFEVIVRSTGTDNVEIGDYVDGYFAAGYPQAYVTDGKIGVRYMLNKPGDVYMIVNSSNGHIESNVRAVLEGRAGNDNNIVWVNDWPYFKIESGLVN